MCGIVGYVGSGSSIEVLLGGLKRLEYRGYDSAGVAVLDGEGVIGSRKHAGKLGILVDDLDREPAARRAHRHRPHPLGDARRTDRRQRASALRRRRQARADPQRHHRELRRAQAGAARRRRHLHERDRHRGRRAARRARLPATPGDLTEALRQTVGRLHGAFTLLVMHQDVPGRRRRRSSQLAARHRARRRRELPRLGCRGVRRAHPSGHGDRSGRDRHDPPRLGRRHRLRRRSRRRPRPFEVAWDASAAEKGGWPSFMKKEISEEPEAVANTMLGRVHDGRVTLHRTRCRRRHADRHRPRRRSRVRHRRVRRHGRQVRDRGLGAHPRRRRALARVPLPRSGARRPHARGVDQPVRRDHGHAHGRQVRPRAGRPHGLDLQHAGRDDPARIGCRALHARRPGGRGGLDEGLRRAGDGALPLRPAPRARCAAR